MNMLIHAKPVILVKLQRILATFACSQSLTVNAIQLSNKKIDWLKLLHIRSALISLLQPLLSRTKEAIMNNDAKWNNLYIFPLWF